MAITYDAVACQVWLDPLDAAPGGAQPLCSDHASRLSPPRGWVVLDRRNSQASLMTISPPLVEQAGRRGVARRRFPRRWGQFDEPRLEFVGPDATEQPGAEYPTAEQPGAEYPTAEQPGAEQPTAEPPGFGEIADLPPTAALESVTRDDVDAPAETAVDPVIEPAASSSPSRRVDEPEADLTTMLKPKGRLLGRAFDVTGDQHSVLTGASGVVDASPADRPDIADG